jgi:branched-chain amino acid aminotransferase
MAGCLHPNNALAMIGAHDRGFDNCVMLDQQGFVAELAIANLFMARDGMVFTPAPNGTFLDGIARQRIMKLLRNEGSEIVESGLRFDDFLAAEEIFSTGNLRKVQPVVRIDDHLLQPGPMFRRAREVYWAYAYASASKAA